MVLSGLMTGFFDHVDQIAGHQRAARGSGLGMSGADRQQAPHAVDRHDRKREGAEPEQLAEAVNCGRIDATQGLAFDLKDERISAPARASPALPTWHSSHFPFGWPPPRPMVEYPSCKSRLVSRLKLADYLRIKIRYMHPFWCETREVIDHVRFPPMATWSAGFDPSRSRWRASS